MGSFTKENPKNPAFLVRFTPHEMGFYSTWSLLYLLLGKSHENGRSTTNGDFYEGKQGKTGQESAILVYLE